jgi:LacI family transcriptional regulator
MAVTRDDVARLAGVSAATVSYVINNGPRPVASKTRMRVLNAVKQLGYQPSGVARNLRLQRTSTLGLIVPDTHNPYFSELARGVESVAFENSYTVILCHSGYDADRENQYIDMLRVQRAAGVIWIPATTDFDPYEKLLGYGVPTVIIDRTNPGYDMPTVVADNYQGGFLATSHLLELGHKRIGYISRSEDLSHSDSRIKGYLSALEEKSIPFDPKLVVKGGFRLENGKQAIDYLLQLDSRPTAVFAYNDIMAIGALRALHEAGLRVPEDFSLIGFDDIDQAGYTCPALTTVYMPKYKIGQQGTKKLLEIIDKKPTTNELLASLEVYLVVRESTGPAPEMEAR